jgi:hypothetical protein
MMHGGKAPQVIRKAQERLTLRGITKDRTLLELARLAYGDVALFFNDDGSVKQLSDLGPDERALLAGYDVVIGNIQGGDGKQDVIHKPRFHNKNQALEVLAKYFEIIKPANSKEDIAAEVMAKIDERIAEGRRRASEYAVNMQSQQRQIESGQPQDVVDAYLCSPSPVERDEESTGCEEK